MFRIILAISGLAVLPTPLCAQQAEGRDKIVNVSSDDREMNAAIAEAQRTLPEFLKIVERPPADVRDISFKYPLRGWEHIWVGNVTRKGDTLIGELENEPAEKGYRLGQQVEVPLSQVSDWAYRGANGVMRGHRTTRVLLARLPSEEAEQIRQYMGWD